MRYLIINADDFGMSQEVNEGIKLGIEAGVITSVSLMVNMPFFDDAVEYLKKHPEVSVGLHFNITEGDPLLKPSDVSSLLREDNHYFSWMTMVFKLLTNQYEIKEVDRILRMHYKILEKTGLKITHIDSHHHIHLYPTLFQLLAKFAEKKHVSALRCRRFSFWSLTNGFRKKPSMKQLVILSLCLINNLRSKEAAHLYDVNSIYDVNWSASLTKERFMKILSQIPQGVTELICHPALVSKDGNAKFLEPRFQRLKLLLDPDFKTSLDEFGIKLVNREQLLSEFGRHPQAAFQV